VGVRGSIQDYGINFESLHYDSAKLHPYRGVKSGLPIPAADRWEVRYDPYRLQSIFVRDHTRGVWIDAEWSLAKRTLAPFSLDVLHAARTAVARRSDTVPGVDVLAEINRIQTGGATTVKEKKAAIRDSVNTAVVPAVAVVAEPATSIEATPSGELAAVTPDPHSPKRRAARRIDDEDEE